MNYEKLSKEISYALRHAPKEYNLYLDELGFVKISDLLYSINCSHHYDKLITIADLQYIIANSSKKRHQIKDDKIRALYGHSTNDKVLKDKAIPPNILYHGTTHTSIDSIMVDGLKPMSRQYVHLSTDIETAINVGKRKDNNPIVLEINTKIAFNSGVTFYLGNENVWLSDPIPPEYIKRII